MGRIDLIGEAPDAIEDPISRRAVIGLVAATAVSALAPAAPREVKITSRTSELVTMDAVSLASVIHTRRASCVEVMTAYLDHIEQLNPRVNAIVALQDRETLLSQARERDAQLARGESMGPLHGYGIARRIEQISAEALAVNQGTIYLCLIRLVQKKWISASWGTSENNRKAKFYAITKSGKKQLIAETENWERVAGVMGRVLQLASRR